MDDRPATLPVPPETVDVSRTRRALESVTLPVLSPKLLSQLMPSRVASRFDPADALERAMQEPAMLLALYQHGRRTRVTDGDDPLTMVSALGPQGVSRTIQSLRQVSPPTNPAARQWLDAGCRHALAVSRLAGLLAQPAGVDRDLAMAAGLLHDVGRMLLLTGSTAAGLISAYDFAAGAGLDNVYVERNTLGISHKQVGQELCDRCGVPPMLASICATHDYTTAQRSRLNDESNRLTSLVALCDALAKSAGLVGDPTSELRHAPPEMAAMAADHAEAIDQILAQVRADAELRWPLCRDAPEELATDDEAQRLGPTPLAGLRIMLASSPTPWHPMKAPLELAGATVTLARRPLPSLPDDVDAIIFDATADDLSPLLEELRRLQQGASGSATLPWIVLAQRCDEPHERLRDADVMCSLLITPIRVTPLIRAVAQLTAEQRRRQA